ncbi:hypothetical protein [Streptomyces lincolnensis]|uniref:hypothetical protein n=1 Tax=Streptomyces lincolnensis TaxID=1915 RepID=UPI0037D6ACFE
MRKRTAPLIGSLLNALVRALLPPREGHPAAPPQPLVIEKPLPAPRYRPAHICPCEREQIMQRRRARWLAANGIDAELRRNQAEGVSV